MAYKSRGSRPRSPHTTHGSHAPSRSLGKPGAGGRGTGLVLETSKMTRDAFLSNLNFNTGWKAVCIERMHARFGEGASKKGLRRYLVGVLLYKNLGEVVQALLTRHLLAFRR